jgi:hypothetical protein
MGGRVVEGTGLENRQTGNRLVGSNPTPSAIRRCNALDLKRFSEKTIIYLQLCPFAFSRYGIATLWATFQLRHFNHCNP